MVTNCASELTGDPCCVDHAILSLEYYTPALLVTWAMYLKRLVPGSEAACCFMGRGGGGGGGRGGSMCYAKPFVMQSIAYGEGQGGSAWVFRGRGREACAMQRHLSCKVLCMEMGRGNEGCFSGGVVGGKRVLCHAIVMQSFAYGEGQGESGLPCLLQSHSAAQLGSVPLCDCTRCPTLLWTSRFQVPSCKRLHQEHGMMPTSSMKQVGAKNSKLICTLDLTVILSFC